MKVKILRYVDLYVPNMIVDAADIRQDILDTMLANKQAIALTEPEPTPEPTPVPTAEPVKKTRKSKS